MNTSIIYYKRQLSVFNFGVNDLTHRNSSFFVWDETEGKKGSLEVSSALNAFFDTVDLSTVRKIKSFSDTCGGQNRNKQLLAFMMHTCNVRNINEWEHVYLESGHSYLPNDTDFSTLEKIKHNRCIHSPPDWYLMMGNSGIKFKVIEMKNKFNNYVPLLNNLKFSGSGKNMDTERRLDLFCLSL